MMLLFFTFQVIVVVFDCVCIGVLVGYLIPADPSKLPRIAAWLVANSRPKSDSPLPPRVYRWATGVMAAGIVAFTQYGLVLRILVEPYFAVGFAPALAALAIDESLVLAWTAYMVWAFRRAANGSQ